MAPEPLGGSMIIYEIWKDMPRYEGQYQVSSEGRVRSLDRQITQKARSGISYTKRILGVMLRPGRKISGHVSVSLGRNNSQDVHKLVLLAFVGPAPVGCECLHVNGIPFDNRLDNLRWGTRSENNIDAVLHQRRGKLTESQVKDIYARVNSRGHGIGRRLAAEYKVHETTISAIKVRRHYDYFVD